jgi:hypothetical protein
MVARSLFERMSQPRAPKPIPRRFERGVCAVCGKECAVRVPAGGDGSEVRPNRHHAKGKNFWCSGHLSPAKGR